MATLIPIANITGPAGSGGSGGGSLTEDATGSALYAPVTGTVTEDVTGSALYTTGA